MAAGRREKSFVRTRSIGMTISTLDEKSALIVVDLQKGLAGYPFIHPIGEVVDQTRALLDAFRRLGLPVVLVNVAGAGAGPDGAGSARRRRVRRWMDRLAARA
jgi:nicotinamidase-related amidase